MKSTEATITSPEPWMSGKVACVERKGWIHLQQTGPPRGLVVFVTTWPVLMVFGMRFIHLPPWMAWLSGGLLVLMGAALVFQARYWRAQTPVVSYDIAKKELMIPRLGVVMPVERISSIRLGLVRCGHPEGGEYGAASLEYREKENAPPQILYVSADSGFPGVWADFKARAR